MSKLSEKLKYLRTIGGHSQHYIGDYLNISRQGYAHYEKGERTPDYNTLQKLAKLYHISVDDLISEDPLTQDFVQEKTSSYLPYNGKHNTISQKEKKLLYLFSQINEDDQNDIISYLEIKIDKELQRTK